VVAGVAAAGLVAAAAVVAFTLGHGDDDARGIQPAPSNPAPSVAPSGPTEPADTTDPETELRDLPPADDPAYVDLGTTVDYADGSTAVVEGERLTVTIDGQPRTTTVPPDSRLSRVQLQLGQAGVGYRLSASQGGDSATETLVVANGAGGLVAVEPTGDAPFGFGYAEGIGGYLTWTAGDGAGLYTKDSVGDAADNRWEVYRWDVTGPGEGGGATQPPTLVSTFLGTACLDPGTNVVVAC
jgi:hypothetical protein